MREHAIATAASAGRAMDDRLATRVRHLWIAAVAAPLLLLPGIADAQFPACLGNTNEVEIVEPLQSRFVQVGGAGAQAAFVASPVSCSLSLAGCYEFGVLPVTYSGPTSATAEEAPAIPGTITVEVAPVGPPGPTPTGTWDGASAVTMNVDLTFDLSLTTQQKKGAKIQIPADFVPANPVTATTGILAFVRAFHNQPPAPQACGQFQLLKRNLANNEAAAKATEAAPTPVLFIRQAVNTDNEVLPVEALNTEFFQVFGAGAQTVFLSTPVKVAANLCCGAPPDGFAAAQCGADPLTTTPVDCYEFAMTYVSYDPAPGCVPGEQVLHLPNYPAPGVPLCIQAPIAGDIFVRIIPLNNQPLAFFQSPFAKWDGVSTNTGKVFLWTMHNGQLSTNTTYTLPTIRIPAAAVPAVLPPGPGGPGAVVGIVEALHQPLQTGFFSPFKRNFVWNQDLGNIQDALAFPMLFTKNSIDPNALEVILVEPRDLQLVNVFGAGAQLPVAQCVNIGGVDYFRFGITYVTYDVAQVQVHQTTGPFPIVGSLEVSVNPDFGVSSGPTVMWNGSSTTTLFADTTPDLNLGVQSFPHSALVLIKKDAVLGSLPPLPGTDVVVGEVLGTHCEDAGCPVGGAQATGFYNIVKRNFVHTQALGNALDQLPTPLLFQKSGTCPPPPP